MTFINRHYLRPDTTIQIDGTLTAKIDVGLTPGIAVERNLHLTRDRANGWIIYSIASDDTVSDDDVVSGEIDVRDPAINAFLDELYYLIADPETFGKVEIPGPPETTEAA